MRSSEARRAVAAAMSIASAFDMAADEAVVLSDSNRLVVRLLPCDVVARITPVAHFASSEMEVELVTRLALTDAPVAGLDARVEQRVFLRDGFKIAMWTYFEPAPMGVLSSIDYAQALNRLHVGLRQIEFTAPNVMERVAATRRDVVDRDVTPDLATADRALLTDMLRARRPSIVDRRAPEQLLHGEPHPWNVLATTHGPLFIDFENAACGPVEYDLAWAPAEVAERYPDADQDLVGECRGLVLAIVAAHRWSRDDQHPSGRRSGVAFLDVLRRGAPWPALDDVEW